MDRFCYVTFTQFLQSICGISVVPNDYETLKRYNLAEIFEPSPKEQPKKKVEAPTEQPVEIAKSDPDGKNETHVVKEEIDMPAGEAESESAAVAVKDDAAEA